MKAPSMKSDRGPATVTPALVSALLTLMIVAAHAAPVSSTNPPAGAKPPVAAPTASANPTGSAKPAIVTHAAPAVATTGKSVSAKKPVAAKKPLVAHAAPAAVSTADTISAADSSATSDSGSNMELRAGQESTVFRTLTVQGEDRIHIDVERPTLTLDLSPQDAPGLEWGSPLDVLQRTTPDPMNPLLDQTSRQNCAWVARPWLSHFPDGPLARVTPDLQDVASWKLMFVDERGRTVMTYSGTGRPPAEIDWNGRTSDGGPALPGVTYSYVLEARDRAGNKRNFVGEGFRTTSFRFDAPAGPVLLFTGDELKVADSRSDATPPIVLEAATVMNRGPSPACGVRVEVTARSRDQANAMASRLTHWLGPLLAGDPARVKTVALVSPDAPEAGGVCLVATR
jgi:hypothetical protein